MSWGLRLAGDAIADLRDLEIWLQEEVLDELDRLIDDPAMLSQRRTTPTVVFDFTRDRAGDRHYVFVRLNVDEARHQVRVLGISSFSPRRR